MRLILSAFGKTLAVSFGPDDCDGCEECELELEADTERVPMGFSAGV